MALTNIANIDALDTVLNINATDETLLKSFLKELVHQTRDDRKIELFYGQMAAEGFANVGDGEVRIVVESPTIRVRFYQSGAVTTRCQMYALVDSTFVLISELVQAGQFSADGT